MSACFICLILLCPFVNSIWSPDEYCDAKSIFNGGIESYFCVDIWLSFKATGIKTIGCAKTYHKKRIYKFFCNIAIQCTFLVFWILISNKWGFNITACFLFYFLFYLMVILPVILKSQPPRRGGCEIKNNHSKQCR